MSFLKEKMRQRSKLSKKVSSVPLFFNENKGQGALEYLLIIAAAILIAAIVISVLVKTSKGTKEDITSSKDAYQNKIDEAKEEFDLNSESSE